MRTPVVAAFSCAVGVVIGVVATIAVADADDPVQDAGVSLDTQVDCADVITEEALATMGWTGSGPPRERLGRCEWFGEQGNVTAGTLVAPLSEECDEAGGRAGYQASLGWLGDETTGDGCVVVNEDGIGLYEVLAEVDGEVVQVRLAVLEERPVEDVRAALGLLVAATAPAFQ